MKFRFRNTFSILATLLFSTTFLGGQGTGVLQGRVVRSDGEAVHHATVMIVDNGLTAESDHEGLFRFDALPPGTYDVFAYAANFNSEAHLIEVKAGATVTHDFVLQLAAIRQSITVTASGRHETTFDAIQSVNSLDAFDMSEKMAPSIGEVLDGEPGIAKRSFGPGSARPIVRGFDGDRVLVMKDGMRVGSLGSQSGDHGEPIDPASLERVEVVKGPATLLYGSNAIGGVVNAISRHHEIHKHRHEGHRGQLSTNFGSNNGLAGTGGSLEYGSEKWMFWGGGGAQRTGDYASPEGPVENSKSRVANASAGLGWFGDKLYGTLGYSLSDGRYGIPFASELHGHADGSGDQEGEPGHEGEGDVDVNWNYHNVRLTGGIQQVDSFVNAVRASLSYAVWEHLELEVAPDGSESVGTAFDNQEFSYRVDAEQRATTPLTGSFGISGINRDYKATGAEALSPPVDQNGVALFVLEELGFERIRLQFGARVEHVQYEPLAGVDRPDDLGSAPNSGLSTPVVLPERSFTGFSGGVGMRLKLAEKGAFVVNYQNSYRAPALEELYNYGPHVGNLAFEIGNPTLSGERSNGIDLSLRHSGDRIQGEINFFYYGISDFIYPAPTGEYRSGLVEVLYSQGDSRFIGTEARLDLALLNSLWLNLGLDAVDAQLTQGNVPLPRIPPLRGRVGFDIRRGAFSIQPELVMAVRQDQTFVTETPTAGYVVGNLKASFSLAHKHTAHYFSVNVFNLGDALYQNHVSYIKDFAPEIGRGVRFGYVLKFF